MPAMLWRWPVRAGGVHVKSRRVTSAKWWICSVHEDGAGPLVELKLPEHSTAWWAAHQGHPKQGQVCTIERAVAGYHLRISSRVERVHLAVGGLGVMVYHKQLSRAFAMAHILLDTASSEPDLIWVKRRPVIWRMQSGNLRVDVRQRRGGVSMVELIEDEALR